MVVLKAVSYLQGWIVGNFVMTHVGKISHHFVQVKFDRKLLDFDYGEEEDDNDVVIAPSPKPQPQLTLDS